METQAFECAGWSDSYLCEWRCMLDLFHRLVKNNDFAWSWFVVDSVMLLPLKENSQVIDSAV